MIKFLIAYVVALVVLGALDALWLTATKGFYLSQIGTHFAPKVEWWAVIIFYLLYAAAIAYFLQSSPTAVSGAVTGAVLGFTAYMTYDFVNAATLSPWPLQFLVVDIAWGTVITAIASAAAVYVEHLI